MKSKTDSWVEMSVREIWTQCHFAETAYFNMNNIDIRTQRPTDVVFISIHSFLSHCVMVSKMLKACDGGVSSSFLMSFFNMFKKHKHVDCTSIGNVLNVSSKSLVHKRKFRNHLEHYDERLKNWIKKYPANINIGTYNVGPKNMISGKIVHIKHYDPTTKIFTFVDKDFNLGNLKKEISEIKTIADEWVKKMQAQVIKPPFIVKSSS